MKKLNNSYPSWIFTSKSGEARSTFAEKSGGLIEAGTAVLAAVLNTTWSLDLAVSTLVAWVGALALVACSSGRVFSTGGPVTAGAFFAGGHLKGTGRAGESWWTKAEWAGWGCTVIVTFFSLKPGKADSAILADRRIARGQRSSVGESGPVVSWNRKKRN